MVQRLYDYILEAEVELGRLRRPMASGGFPSNTEPAIKNVIATLDDALKMIREGRS